MKSQRKKLFEEKFSKKIHELICSNIVIKDDLLFFLEKRTGKESWFGKITRI